MTALFFNISGGEIFIILLIIFIFFGPDKIPEIARWLGKGVNEVKKATNDIRDEITKETAEVKTSSGRLAKDIEKALNTDASSDDDRLKDDESNKTKPLTKDQA